MDTSDWALFGMGTASLFPLAGAIGKLRGFFPPRYRAWFVTLSTLFSLGLYLFLQWAFPSLWPYVPLWVSFPTAFVALVVYLLLHLSVKDGYTKLEGFKLAITLVIGLILYTAFVASTTYSFNVLERSRLHAVYYGITTIERGSWVRDAHITFNIGAARKTTSSTFYGYYSQILEDSEMSVLSGVVGEWFDRDRDLTYGITLDRSQVTSDGFHWLRLVRFGE